MLRTHRIGLSAALLSLTATAVACGGTESSEFGLPKEGDKTISQPGGEFADGSNSVGPRSTTDACVSSTSSALLQKVNLVFMYDRSGSMGDTTNDPPFDPNLKWVPVGTGMKSFFNDARSQSMNASLAFFPLGGDVAQNCTAAYATPKVPLSAISSAAAFTSAIDTTQPKGGTPTLPALQGAITYAKQVAAKHPDEKSVVVLVTDGEPGFMINGSFQAGCPDNDIEHVAAAASAAFKGTPSIPTYVIGVGPSLTNLNRIAAAGGTSAASMVSISDPAKTATTFQSTLEKIRGQVQSCDFAIPPPPEGKVVDPMSVNVAYQAGTGEQILSYNKDCASGAGWRYDNASAPTRIQLCPTTCDAARTDAAGKLTLAFGCKTKGDLR